MRETSEATPGITFAAMEIWARISDTIPKSAQQAKNINPNRIESGHEKI